MTPINHTTSFVLEQVRLPGSKSVTSIVVLDGLVWSVDNEPYSPDIDSLQHINVDGRTVLPGFWDAHVHVESWAVSRRRLDLTDALSANMAVEKTQRAVKEMTHPGDLLVGYGYRDALWPDAPHKDLLEVAAPGAIVALQSNDLHTAWLSPAALKRIGLADHPTGVLREIDCYRAMEELQEFGDDQIDRWVADALSEAASHGVTGLMDFEFGDSLPAWVRRAGQQRLTVRVACTVYRQHLTTAIERGLRTGQTAPDTEGLVEVGPLKVFVDGSLNSRSALCHDPYPDSEGSHAPRGLLETPPEDLHQLMRLASSHGLHCAVHAIGDRAIELAIDAFEQIACAGRIEHAQLLPRGGAERIARLGLTVGIQPAHLTDDWEVADRHWSGRTDRAFAYADMVAAGIPVELGSDAPVTPLDPWLGIRAAVTRLTRDRRVWHPEQRVGIAESLAAASRRRTGLRPGAPADLVILDHDPFRADLTGLTDPGVAGTIVGGVWTHRAL